MSRKISIFRYIAENNTDEAIALLEDYNIKGNRKDIMSITNGLKSLAKNNDNKNLRKRIIAIHPDKSLFNKEMQEIIESERANIKKEAQSVNFLNADGDKDALKKQNTDIKVTNIAVGLLIGFGVTIGIVGLVKMIK